MTDLRSAKLAFRRFYDEPHITDLLDRITTHIINSATNGFRMCPMYVPMAHIDAIKFRLDVLNYKYCVQMIAGQEALCVFGWSNDNDDDPEYMAQVMTYEIIYE